MKRCAQRRGLWATQLPEQTEALWDWLLSQALCVRAVVARIRLKPLGARTSGSGSIRRGV
jgi:hypothetical protein